MGLGIRLLAVEDLQRSLSSDNGPLDSGLAEWAIEIVSAAAVDVTGASWASPDDVPPGVLAVLGLAVRRLYTNPDRFTRESEGDYSYGLDSSVTKSDVFTPSERATLLQYRVSRRPRGIGTIGTTRGDPRLSTRYVPDGTENGFPWYADEFYWGP